MESLSGLQWWLPEFSHVIKWHRSLHIHCTNVSFLVLLLPYKYVRCNHCEDLGEGYRRYFCTHCHSLWIYNYFKIKKLNKKNPIRDNQWVDSSMHLVKSITVQVIFFSVSEMFLGTWRLKYNYSCFSELGLMQCNLEIGVSFYLKCISCRQHIIGSCFLSALTIFVF